MKEFQSSPGMNPGVAVLDKGMQRVGTWLSVGKHFYIV